MNKEYESPLKGKSTARKSCLRRELVVEDVSDSRETGSLGLSNVGEDVLRIRRGLRERQRRSQVQQRIGAHPSRGDLCRRVKRIQEGVDLSRLEEAEAFEGNDSLKDDLVDPLSRRSDWDEGVARRVAGDGSVVGR